ncbi:hypothetical protein NECAME_15327 [Necator americanus]|uniref:Uncharacterized protein n=1 Tax=Necator americanus TaxID=51031 RepID=W2SKP7_NECAM|nr:hypothetical protein NECAME_15327 [Necator americanus]ETN69431.1 hypothetical protein NECAME_15327 [Necator americanus]
MYINRGHLVLLDALPGCMIHVTVDELLVEAFRSRDGWQLEVSCRLARGKAMLRKVTTGHSLLDVALQFRLSLDVANGRRTMTLSLRALSVSKDGGKMKARIVDFMTEDQTQRLTLRSSLLVLSQEINKTGISIQLSSDSVLTRLSVQDVVWWNNHVEECLTSVIGKTMVSSKSAPQHSLPLHFAVELASISCDLVDVDSFQSALSVQFFSVIKTEDVLEVGVDCFCISAPNVNVTNATFENHQWGHSVYIGAALVQYCLSGAGRGLLIGIDDCKIEWSDKLAEQVKQLTSVLSACDSTNRDVTHVRKAVNLRLHMKRAAVISVAKDSFYLTLLFDEVKAESAGSRNFAVTAHYARIVFGSVQGTHLDLHVIRNTVKFVPPPDRGSDAPWRCWNQFLNDAMTWRIPSLTFDSSSVSLSAISPQLVVNMNGLDIITAIDVCITRRMSDVQMIGYRRGFKEFEIESNKVWTWAAASFLFYLPHEFNFAQVFDEFVNSMKWIKLVHGLKKDPFPPDAPLPADIRIILKEARLELEDDPFENLLQMSHELKEDEVSL